VRRSQRFARGQVAIGPLVGLLGLLGLLTSLTITAGLDGRGWAVGVALGVAFAVLVARSMAHHDRTALGPADRVTFARGVIACAVAGLAATSVGSAETVPALVLLAAVALALDGVDGRIARRTRTASTFGARFDGEVDAFLILVLSAYVCRGLGWWVLSLGLARYVFLAAGQLLPWLRATPPPRAWAKVVAVTVGVLLAVAASGVVPEPLMTVALLVALGLLTESFCHTVWQLWRLAGGRALPRGVVTGVAAVLLLWAALVIPDRLAGLTPGMFLRVPVELMVLVTAALVLPSRGAAVVAVSCGVGLGVLTLLRVLDLGFMVAFDSPFHLVYDASYAGPALDLVSTAVGRVGAILAAVGVAAVVVALLTMLPLAALRLTRLVSGHRRAAVQGLAAMTVIAVVPAALRLTPGPGGSVASTAAARNAQAQVMRIRDDLRDQRQFADEVAQEDPFAGTPERDLLTRLRGKDVLVVFVESYGRAALGAADVDAALDSGTRRLESAGLSARSGWLRSSTFGGMSWLAHLTLLSGLWVDNQKRYDDLIARGRLTLPAAFHRAGWRTVAVNPAIENDWPEASTFYHFDQLYDSRNLGYAGPRFGWATMPDQFALARFQRDELGVAGRPPIMAVITLVSSHWPWTPLPRLVDWDAMGDGAVFAPMAAQHELSGGELQDGNRMRGAYARSIAYSLDVVTTFVQRVHDPNLVMVVLGDHQPSSLVSGEAASRDVPVTLIASDPSALRPAVDWGWRDGLRPSDDGPVWPMHTFRDRFLSAYSAPPPITTQAAP
jgi:phosphatidylglycerophosphate synthase